MRTKQLTSVTELASTLAASILPCTSIDDSAAEAPGTAVCAKSGDIDDVAAADTDADADDADAAWADDNGPTDAATDAVVVEGNGDAD